MKTKTIITLCLPLLLVGATAGAMGNGKGPNKNDGTVETFRCKGKKSCSNEAGWSFSHLSEEIITEKGHGKPRHYFHMSGEEFIPFLDTDPTAETAFHGDYAARGVESIEIDTRIPSLAGFCGTEGRPMTLELVNLGPTDSFDDDCAVYLTLEDENGDLVDIPTPGVFDWTHYAWPVDASSPTLPEGWTVHFDRCLGMTEDEAWQTVINDVEQVQFCWDFCDNLSIACDWTVDVDNIRLTESGN